MDEILRYLIRFCSDLYLKYHFKFIDSNTSDSFSETYLILASDDVKIRFIKDRGELFLDFQSAYQKKKNKWYSLDIIRKLLINEDGYHALLDEDNGIFLQRNLMGIIELFSVQKIKTTLSKLAEIEKERVRYFFGNKK